jgi:glycosyltransferase involved in cell wall biosynthesis
MSLGCPVLLNRTSSLPEVCGDAAFYFNGSADELSHSLKSTLEDEQQLTIKRKLGAEQVKLYEWSRCAQSTLDVYRVALGG